MPWSLSTDKLEKIAEESDSTDGYEDRAGRDLRTVREFLETLSAKLAGGPVEGTRVAQLYDHPAYLPGRSTSKPSSPAPPTASTAHAQLKRLVARVVEEAASLPALAQYAAEPRVPSVENSTYEDLLATAILNKVIERYQTENGSGGRSSGIHSASASPTPSERSSPRSLRGRQLRDITPPLREEDEDASDWEEGEATDEALELPRRVPFPEFGGDIVHSTAVEDRDFDEVSGSDIQASDGTWEENWLFQRKKIKSMQSVSVPMLVPNSNTDYRALIGDRDADDTTDLSDNISDDEEELEYKSDAKRVLDSKHVIGGKTKVDIDFDEITGEEAEVNNNAVNKTIIEATNDEVDAVVDKVDTVNENVISPAQESILVLDIDSGPLPKTEFSVTEEIHRTLMNGFKDDFSLDIENGVANEEKDDLQRNKDFRNNTLNGHEREGEYEETVTKPVQRYADSLRRKHFDDDTQTIPTRDTDNDEDLVPGTIAYRERKKWLNYVEMPNNPYSPEAIQKRLSAKSTSSIFDLMTKGNIDEALDHETKDEITNDDKGEERKENGETKVNGHEKSPSPKILKDVLAEEVPQYKRYGRDYYIKEAKASSGGRRKGYLSETSSLSSLNKSTSLDNFDTEFASTVSASSSLSDLEAAALHHSISRVVLSPRHASPNFAINPIFETSERNDDTDKLRPTNVSAEHKLCDGDGYVENDDIVRLKIPKVPEITEDLYESYTNVRRSNTLRSDDLNLRTKKRPTLKYTFGGSLRLSNGRNKDLW